MDFGLPAMIRLGLDWPKTFGGSVEAVPVKSLSMLGSGGRIRLLLRGYMLAV